MSSRQCQQRPLARDARSLARRGGRRQSAAHPRLGPAPARARVRAGALTMLAQPRRGRCTRDCSPWLARQRSRFSVKASAPCIAEPAPSMTRPSVRRAAPTGLSIMVTGSKPPRGGLRTPVPLSAACDDQAQSDLRKDDVTSRRSCAAYLGPTANPLSRPGSASTASTRKPAERRQARPRCTLVASAAVALSECSDPCGARAARPSGRCADGRKGTSAIPAFPRPGP